METADFDQSVRTAAFIVDELADHKLPAWVTYRASLISALTTAADKVDECTHQAQVAKFRGSCAVILGTLCSYIPISFINTVGVLLAIVGIIAYTRIIINKLRVERTKCKEVKQLVDRAKAEYDAIKNLLGRLQQELMLVGYGFPYLDPQNIQRVLEYNIMDTKTSKVLEQQDGSIYFRLLTGLTWRVAYRIGRGLLFGGMTIRAAVGEAIVAVGFPIAAYDVYTSYRYHKNKTQSPLADEFGKMAEHLQSDAEELSVLYSALI